MVRVNRSFLNSWDNPKQKEEKARILWAEESWWNRYNSWDKETSIDSPTNKWEESKESMDFSTYLHIENKVNSCLRIKSALEWKIEKINDLIKTTEEELKQDIFQNKTYFDLASNKTFISTQKEILESFLSHKEAYISSRNIIKAIYSILSDILSEKPEKLIISSFLAHKRKSLVWLEYITEDEQSLKDNNALYTQYLKNFNDFKRNNSKNNKEAVSAQYTKMREEINIYKKNTETFIAKGKVINIAQFEWFKPTSNEDKVALVSAWLNETEKLHITRDDFI